MSRRFAPALTLLLAACASDPGTQVETATPPTAAPRPDNHEHGRLIGLGVADLGELFGAPALQVREGPGLKLQYRGGGCVLDAYLYPPVEARGVERVTHVEARLPSGSDTDIANCEAAIERSR